ncbi:MAG: peptidylprolyl isomerase [Spirochaetaceae bacterium]|nr:peptidylprolyl isomerase [Spirochaetaceae bacterium]
MSTMDIMLELTSAELTLPFSNDMFSTTIILETQGKYMPTLNKKKDKKDKKAHMQELNSVDRKKKQHPFLWIFSVSILVLIVVTFIGAPLIRGLGNSRSDLVFGKYADTEIIYTYGNYFARQLDLMQNQFKSNGNDNPQYELYQVWKGAFDRTVFHTAILYNAKISGLYVSDRRIDKALTQYGPYMDNGKFSAAIYNATSSADKNSNRQLYREELIQQQFIQDNTERLRPSAELKFIKGMSTNERNFRYVAFPISDYPLEEVSKYGRENESLFRKISISRISLKDNKKEAEAILKQIQDNPAIFEEEAQNYSTDLYADKGGDMGQVNYYSLAGDISNSSDSDAIFTLGEGKISSLIKTPYGYSIYRCNKVSENPDLTSDTELKNILDYMMTSEKGLIEDYFVAKGEEFKTSASKDGFTEAASSLGISYYSTDFFPINYGNSYFLKQVKALDESKYFDTAASDERFLTALFSLKGKDLTEPSIVGNAVLVAQMISEQKMSEEELSYLDSFYPYLISQIQQNELSTVFLKSDLFTNNFMSVFTQRILQN